jgi:hypothetical protein
MSPGHATHHKVPAQVQLPRIPQDQFFGVFNEGWLIISLAIGDQHKLQLFFSPWRLGGGAESSNYDLVFLVTSLYPEII